MKIEIRIDEKRVRKYGAIVIYWKADQPLPEIACPLFDLDHQGNDPAVIEIHTMTDDYVPPECSGTIKIGGQDACNI